MIVDYKTQQPQSSKKSLTQISNEFILEPDADLERAISLEELLRGIQEDIHEMFRHNKQSTE